VIAVHLGSTFLTLFAAFLSTRFVLHRRLGRPWLLVSLALVVMGSGDVLAMFVGPADPWLEAVALQVSLLLVLGFLLTERWFVLKERMESRLRMISEVERSLVGVLDEDPILSIVCDALSNRKGYRLVWIGTGDPDGAIRPVKLAGEETAPPPDIRLRWDDSPEGQGAAGKALRTGGPVFVGRAGADPYLAPWKGIVGEKGIRSAIAARIDVEGAAPMVLTIGSDNRFAFDPAEAEAVSALARRIGAAIQSARRHEFFVRAKGAYDDLLKTQRDGVILVREGRIVRVNASASRMLGYGDPADLVGKEPSAILADPGRHGPLAGLMSEGDAEGERNLWEAEILKKDGSAFDGEITVTWVPRDYAKATFVPRYTGPLGMILFRDITDRKRVLADLRRERDFSGRILEVAGVLVAKLGPRGEILLLNRHFEEVTGYAAPAVLGAAMPDLVIPDAARAAYRRAFEAVLRGESAAPLETPLATRTGEERVVVWNHAALESADGAAKAVIVTATDITESRRLERQVIEMQKMEAVGTLAGGVAHDFNNILTGILGNLDIAQQAIHAESLAALPVRESIKASERAAYMVRQLLDFSRRSPSERRPIALGKIAEEVAHLFSQAIDRRIEVGTILEDGLWLAAADPNQVHQVLMNLCVNARDAIMEHLEGTRDVTPPPGGYRIEIAVQNFVVGEDYCRIHPYARRGEFVAAAISDNGSGMDEATQQRVFEPFFTTKKLGRGTGLGLSTVYGIVKQHEGWVGLESRIGTGSTFRVFLPRAAEATEDPSVPAADRRPGTSKGKETILLADDEDMIRNLARQILELHGYSVITASDGQEAIDLYLRRRGKVDLVLLDQTMPHLSGREVLERIRNLDPGAKVVMSSGYPSGETEGASGFLPKPYRADSLLRIVRETLDAK
jgi:PAS domain S-box-containing protein